MKKAIVTFIQYHTYEFEISDEIYHSGDGNAAVEMAEKQFISDMCSPIANTTYDDVEIEFEDDEE